MGIFATGTNLSFHFWKPLIAGYMFLVESTNKHLGIKEEYFLALIIGVIFAKLVLSWAVVAISYFASEKKQSEWLSKISSKKIKAESPSKWKIKALVHPLFLFSLFVTVGLFWVSEGSSINLVLAVVRPIAIMLLVHFGFQYLPVESWAKKLEKNPHSPFAAGLVFAISVLKSPLHREPLKVEPLH